MSGTLVSMGVPVVLCPLEVERRHLARMLKLRARVVAVGPGADSVARSVAELRGPDPSLIVLCGLAGGLIETERAPRIGWVMDRDGGFWTAPTVPPGDGEPVGVLGVDEPVKTPGRKRQMAEAYGAALVDCESHAFAAAATAANLRWAIVRGVSDGPGESLPTRVMDWVDGRGRTRLGRLVLSIVLEPSVLPAVLRLAMRAGPAMRAAAARVIELLEIESLRESERMQPARVAPAARTELGAADPRPGSARS